MEEVRIRGERPKALIHDPLALAEVSNAAVIARSWVEPVLQHRWLDSCSLPQGVEHVYIIAVGEAQGAYLDGDMTLHGLPCLQRLRGGWEGRVEDQTVEIIRFVCPLVAVSEVVQGGCYRGMNLRGDAVRWIVRKRLRQILAVDRRVLGLDVDVFAADTAITIVQSLTNASAHEMLLVVLGLGGSIDSAEAQKEGLLHEMLCAILFPGRAVEEAGQCLHLFSVGRENEVIDVMCTGMCAWCCLANAWPLSPRRDETRRERDLP